MSKVSGLESIGEEREREIDFFPARVWPLLDEGP